MMMSIRAGVALGAVLVPITAGAAPVLLDARINQQLRSIDVAGVHFGDTVEQARAELTRRGYTRKAVMTQHSFSDAVKLEAGKHTGRPHKAVGAKVPNVEVYKKALEEVEITYRPHPLGTLVYKIVYRHEGVSAGPALDAFQAQVVDKYSKTGLATVHPGRYCFREDEKCFAMAGRGRTGSDYPAIRYQYSYSPLVIMDAGDEADAAFESAFAEAVARVAGPIKPSF